MIADHALDLRSHWESIYLERGEQELSWHQDDAALSFATVARHCPGGGRVIDVGGGTSLLASRLVAEAMLDVTVVDLSGAALRRAQERSGVHRSAIRWVVGDVCGPTWPVPDAFDVWHDRAVFHFLTDPGMVAAYVRRARQTLRQGGHAVVATFAPDGPEQCSGLTVRRYGEGELALAFQPAGFTLVDSFRDLHRTPWGAEQPFVYAVLRADRATT